MPFKLPALVCLTFSFMCFSSCSNKVSTNTYRLHRLPVNKYGDFDPIVSKSKLTHNYKKQAAHIDQILQSIKLSKKRKVLVFIHGGLGTRSAWSEKIERLAPVALKDGYYPIFVTWRSGLLTSIKGRYTGVRNGVDRPKSTAFASFPFYLASDMAKGIAAIPEATADQIASYTRTHVTTNYCGVEKDIKSFGKNYPKSIHYTTYAFA